MSSKTVVLAFFKDEVAADDAVESLKAWDKRDDDIKLSSIGVLVLDDKGKIEDPQARQVAASARVPGSASCWR